MKKLYQGIRLLQVVIAVLFFMLHMQSNASQQAQSLKDPLRLMIICDAGGADSNELLYASLGTPGPNVVQLANGIAQKIPMLVSTPILFALMLADKPTPDNPYSFLSLDEDQLNTWLRVKVRHLLADQRLLWNKRDVVAQLVHAQSEWMIFESQEKDFALLVPKNYRNVDSMNFSGLTQMSPENVREHFYDETIYLEKSIDVDNLDRLLNTVFDKDQPKNILLSGHGSSGSHIAGLELPQYKNLLSEFKRINVRFLLVESCYIGGPNVIKGHEEFLKEQETPFVIAIGGTEDTPSSHESNIKFESYLNDFFERLEIWQRATHGAPSFDVFFTDQFPAGISLSAIFIPLYSQSPGRQNLPSVLLPGSTTFIPISLPITLNITYDLVQQASNLISIDGNEVEGVQVSPAIIKNKPIIINGSKMPYFISKIPGNGLHIIESLIAPEIELSSLINGFLSKDKNVSSSTGWLFNVCICKNSTMSTLPQGIIVLSGLAMFRRAWLDNKVLFRSGDKFFHASIEDQAKGLGNLDDISLDFYIDCVKDWSGQAMPEEKDFGIVTGSQESFEGMLQAFKDFLHINPVNLLQSIASRYKSSDNEPLQAAAIASAFAMLALDQSVYNVHADSIDQALDYVGHNNNYRQLFTENILTAQGILKKLDTMDQKLFLKLVDVVHTILLASESPSEWQDIAIFVNKAIETNMPGVMDSFIKWLNDAIYASRSPELIFHIASPIIWHAQPGMLNDSIIIWLLAAAQYTILKTSHADVCEKAVEVLMSIVNYDNKYFDQIEINSIGPVLAKKSIEGFQMFLELVSEMLQSGLALPLDWLMFLPVVVKDGSRIESDNVSLLFLLLRERFHSYIHPTQILNVLGSLLLKAANIGEKDRIVQLLDVAKKYLIPIKTMFWKNGVRPPGLIPEYAQAIEEYLQ